MATLSNDSQGGLDYIGIFDGKLVQRVPEGTVGARGRALMAGPNEGKTIYERQYSCVTGMITGGGIVLKEFGGKKVKEIHINLDANVLLQFPFNMLRNIAQPLPNVDISREVMISVYKNKKGRTGLSISQGGINCEWHYTRENPNGLPSATKDALGEWDFRDHDTFLTTKVNDFFGSLETLDPNANPFTDLIPESYDECPPVTDADVPKDPGNRIPDEW